MSYDALPVQSSDDLWCYTGESKKQQQMQLLHIMLLTYMHKQQICPWNVTYMPYKQIVHVQISDNKVSMYTSYKFTTIKNVITNTGIHTFTSLAYAPEHLCLSHHASILQCPKNVVYI